MRFIFFAVLIHACAYCETPAPATHWGSLAFPNASSSLEAGLSFNRFTPEDGYGVPYDSTIKQALGFNILGLSWNKSWPHGFVTNVTAGVSITGNQPTQLMQDAIHFAFHFPKMAKFDGRTTLDFMADGSVTKWFSPLANINLFVGAGLSAGTIYKEIFARAGFRRLPITPSWYDGNWGSMDLRASLLGRVSLQASSAVATRVANAGRIIQSSLSIGQYKTAADGTIVPTWEGEFALMWDSGIFANEQGDRHYGFYWTASVIVACFRAETWNDSIGTSFISPFTDYGPTFGITFGVDLLAL